MHTDARGYARAIAAGEYEAAYLIARGPNPLASICGRVCGAPCEAACRRGSIDQPIAIRALKRFVADQFASRARDPQSFAQGECDGLEEMATLARFLAAREYRKPEGMRVAIIGSGPAGWPRGTIWHSWAWRRQFSKPSRGPPGCSIRAFPPTGCRAT